MKKFNLYLLLLVSSTLLFSACAPAAGRASVQYQAPSQEVIGAIAEIAVNMVPLSGYNYFSINSINDRFVTLQSDRTGGASFLFGAKSLTLSFTALQNGDVTTLAANGDGSSDLVKATIKKITSELDARFTRVN